MGKWGVHFWGVHSYIKAYIIPYLTKQNIILDIIKNPSLIEGFLYLPSGEYEISTHASLLHDDGLAIPRNHSIS